MLTGSERVDNERPRGFRGVGERTDEPTSRWEKGKDQKCDTGDQRGHEGRGRHVSATTVVRPAPGGTGAPDLF